VGERPHVAAASEGLVDQLEGRLGQSLGGEVAEHDRCVAVDGEVAQPLEELGVLLGAEAALGRELEDGVALAADDADERLHLGPGRQSGRDGAIVGGGVCPAARRGEPGGAGAQRGPQLGGHRGEILVGGGLLERSLAHGEGAERRVTDRRGVVQPLGQPVERVEVLGEGLPGPGDALGHGLPGDVLGPFEAAHDECFGPPAGGGEREPAVAHHHAGHPVPARRHAEVVPEELGVHVGVGVDEARCDHQAVGVDLLAPRPLDVAHFDDPVADHGDVALAARRARTVDDGPAAHDEIELPRMIHTNYYLTPARPLLGRARHVPERGAPWTRSRSLRTRT
jgi:hypothetical protein